MTSDLFIHEVINSSRSIREKPWNHQLKEQTRGYIKFFNVRKIHNMAVCTVWELTATKKASHTAANWYYRAGKGLHLLYLLSSSTQRSLPMHLGFWTNFKSLFFKGQIWHEKRVSNELCRRHILLCSRSFTFGFTKLNIYALELASTGCW